ncbi:MAG: TolC family protein [Flavobacteriales bacterium]
MKRYFLILVSIFSLLLSAQAQVWTLDSCVKYALEKNISIQQSALNVETAKINETQAWGGMLPNLNAQASHGYNWGQRIDPFTNQFATQRIQSNSFGISTSINLFSGFQQWNTVKQSEINSEVSRWNLEKMKNDIALNVASAYLNVVVNQEVAQIARLNLENTEAQVTRILKLVEAGQLSEGNLNDILAQKATDEANVIAAENNHYLAKLTLVQLLQLDRKVVEEFEVVVPNIDDLESMKMIDNVDVIVEAALRNFPEIKSAEASLLSSDYGLKIAKGGAIPRLSASYSYGSGYSGAARVITGTPDTLSYPIGTVFGTNQLVFSYPQPVYTTDDYTTKSFESQLKDNVNQSLFFSLTIPIFNGFSNRGNIKRAEISQLQSKYQLEQTKLNLSQSVERSFADARASLANYNAAKLSLDASEKAMTWAQVRYENGSSNLAEYTDARTRLDRARASMLQNKYDYLFKLKILDFYLGQPINLK